jgi:diguanylate cyclase (GGDEF)-like protein/PAS domain S-box-containing protein
MVYQGRGHQMKEQESLKRRIQELEQLETRRERVEEQLRESEERYRSLVENANEAIFVAQDWKLVFLNPMTSQMIGYSPEELRAKPFVDFIHPDDRNMLVEYYFKRLKGDDFQSRYPFRCITKDGRIRWVEISVVRIDWAGSPAALNFVTDITDRKQAEEALQESEKKYRELSIIDDLTQLFNSRHFYVQLKIELERSSRYELPLTLLLLDLDDFKAFNDAYGHVEGDRVLSRLGQVVKRCLRETDSAYRYGGEEFTILLPMTISADGAFTAERIRTELRKETFSPVPGRDAHVTASIGLGQYKPQEDMKAFVHRVDQLMYQGKMNGKNRIYSES